MNKWPTQRAPRLRVVPTYCACRRALALALIALGIFFLSVPCAHALIDGNLKCDEKPIIRYYFEAGERAEINITGRCTVTRRFPYGAALNQKITLTSGIGQPRFTIFNNYTNTILPEVALGSDTGVCLGAGAVCREARIGTVLPYDLTLKAIAPAPGNYMFFFQFGVTSINWQNYAEWVFQTPITYTVTAPACSLTSPNSENLNFGSLSSADYATAKQTARISVSCLSAKTAELTLTSSQPVFNAFAGLSYTHLSGLVLQAQWADTNAPVTLNETREIQFATGSNTVAISFIPYVLTAEVPTGTFQNQYTLTINYR